MRELDFDSIVDQHIISYISRPFTHLIFTARIILWRSATVLFFQRASVSLSLLLKILCQNTHKDPSKELIQYNPILPKLKLHNVTILVCSLKQTNNKPSTRLTFTKTFLNSRRGPFLQTRPIRAYRSKSYLPNLFYAAKK